MDNLPPAELLIALRAIHDGWGAGLILGGRTLGELLPQAADTIERLEARVREVRNVIENGGFRLSKGEPVALERGGKCDHERYDNEDCISCYDEALIAALATKGAV